MSSFRRFCFILAFALCVANPASAQWGSTPDPQPQPQEGWASQPPQTQGQYPDPQQDVMSNGGNDVSRLNRLENQLRQMNGQLEQLQFQNKRLEDLLKRQQEDLEFRFQDLQGGKGQTAPGVRPPQRRTDAAPSVSTPSAPELTPITPPPITTTTTITGGGQLGTPPKPLGQIQADAAGNPVDISAGARAGTNAGSQLEPLPPLPGTAADSTRPSFAPQSQATRQAVAAPSNSPKDEYDLAYGYVLRGDYEMAEGAFKSYLQNHPGDANVANATYWLGEAQYQRKQYKVAAESFLKVYNDHAGAPKAPESLLRLGMSLKALGQKDPACATFAEVSRKYPKASAAVKSRVQTEQRSAGC